MLMYVYVMINLCCCRCQCIARYTANWKRFVCSELLQKLVEHQCILQQSDTADLGVLTLESFSPQEEEEEENVFVDEKILF